MAEWIAAQPASAMMNRPTTATAPLSGLTAPIATIIAMVAARYAANTAQALALRWIAAKARKGTKDRKPIDQTGTKAHQIWRRRPQLLLGACGAGARSLESAGVISPPSVPGRSS